MSNSIKQVPAHKRLSRIGWVVDVQQDFMLPHGRLPVPGAYAVVPNLQRALLWMRGHCDGLVYTGDWHSRHDPEISDNPDFKTTFPLHCAGNESWPLTFGAHILPELEITPDFMTATMVEDADAADAQAFISDFMELRVGFIRKNRFNVFEGNPQTTAVLEEILEPGASVFIVGVAADVCVDQAVRGFAERGYQVTVFLDCIASLNVIPHDTLIDSWSALGVTLATTPTM